MTEHFGQGPALEIDQRPRQLLEKYASLIGSTLMDTADGLVQFDVPERERGYWDNAEVISVALMPEALDEDPEAQVLAVGSPLFDRLLAAVRARGYREMRGMVPPSADPSPTAAELPVPVQAASAEPAGTELTLLPVGRLLARVSIRAGTRVEERLVETPPVDFSSGMLLPDELVAGLATASAPRSSGQVAVYPGATLATARPAVELLPMLFGEIEKKLAPELARARDEATRALGAEQQRLARYYQAMLDDVEAGDLPDDARDRKSAINAEWARRVEEEESRSRLRVTVHPLQISEWQVLAQRATWRLATAAGRGASLSATRLLSGVTTWTLVCPGCGGTPLSIRVCRHGHAACPACSEVCGVCGEGACRTHGLATCATEGHPVCAEDARTCTSCGGGHCATHLVTCRPGDHDVCPSCALHCAHCEMETCKAHATHTGADAPRGSRWLCAQCVVLCEGGNDEPVGVDEAVRCTSCERHICERHKVNCAVDGQPHCSRHLRRSDRSARLSCEAHRASCADEPGSSMASDEIFACAECGRMQCDGHGGKCDADGAVLCRSHLAPLRDNPGALGCAAHRTACYVDNVSFSLTGTQVCPVCARAACLTHRLACRYCARQVCTGDVEEGRCATCRKLADVADPPDDVMHAALAANAGQPIAARGYRMARDQSHTVVEISLGWTRKMVFSVIHGDTKPRTVMTHSMLGSSRKR